MDSVNRDNTLRVFREGRMAPWEPDHKAFIDLELKKMAHEFPEAAEQIRKEYEDKMAKYLEAHPSAVIPADEVVNVEAPKKRGRPAKVDISSTPL